MLRCGLVIATPVVAYLLGPVLKRKEYLEWIAIGDVTEFPPGETKLVTFRNPFTDPWDGATANVPAYVRCTRAGELTVFAINCAHLDVRCGGFRSRSCSCVLAMAACTTRMAAARRDRRSADCLPRVKIESGKLMIDAGQMPTLWKSRGAAATLRPCAASADRTNK